MRTEDLEAFRAWLAGALAASLPGVPVVAGPMPDGQYAPDRCITVSDYSGPETPNWRTEPRVQIRMRSVLPGPGVTPYVNCHQLADAVDAAVAPPDQENLVIDLAGGRTAILKKLNGPMPVGPDAKGRWELTINVALDYAKV